MNASERWHREHERIRREVRKYLGLDQAGDETTERAGVETGDEEEVRAS